MGLARGANLGGAQGRITIDVTQLAAAQQAVLNASRQMTQAMNQINPPLRRAQVGSEGLAGALRQLSGAFGVTLGVAGAVQLGRAAVAVNQLAVAYDRQKVAAASLAGSQSRLNELLATYANATRNAVDDATALADVTSLITQGFADSSAELDRFLRGVRGATVATGKSQEFIITRLQLELLNQTGQRLNEIGLSMENVRARAAALTSANRGLTREQAYQQAVLDELLDKFGKLADSPAADPSGVESAAKQWRNLRLELGQISKFPLDALGNGLAVFIAIQTARLQQWIKELDVYIELLQRLGIAGNLLTSSQSAFISASAGRDVSRHTRPSASVAGFTDEQTAVITDWFRQTEEIERQANQARLEATRQYEQQRADTIRQYEQTIAREAQDFAISRARAQEDYAISLERQQRDIQQQEQRAAQELARTIAQRESDSAETVARARADSAKRLTQLEEDYARERVRRERDFRDSLLDAAGRLDAKSVAEAQRNFRRQEEDAKEAHDDQRKRLEEQLQERLADEAAALDKSIRQQNEAYQRQLEEARQANAQRLEDQAADFTLRQQRENEDRAIRLQRLKEDHDAQLAEQARAHLARIVQINQQEADELQAVNDAFDDRMAALDVYHGDYLEKQNAFQTASLIAYQQYLDALEAEVRRRNSVPATTPGGWSHLAVPSLAPNVISHTTPRANVTIGTIAPSIVINGTTGLDSAQIDAAVYSGLLRALEEVSN